MGEWITIKQFYYHHETFLYESKLKSEDIDCFMKDEAIVTVDPFLSNAVGGIKLQVQPEDVEKAKAIIDAIDANKEEARDEAQATVTVKSKSLQNVLPAIQRKYLGLIGLCGRICSAFFLKMTIIVMPVSTNGKKDRSIQNLHQ